MSDAKANILIAIPTHTGQIEYKCVLSLLEMRENLIAAGIRYEIQFIAGSSLIANVRNYFGNRVAFDQSKSGKDFSHLLFIDSDVSGFEDFIVEMVQADKPIVALPYSLKYLNWENLAEAVKKDVPLAELRRFVGDPVIHTDKQFPVYEIARVNRVGTGMMLIKREVLQALANGHPEWKYKARPADFHGNPITNREFQYNFFQMSVDPKTLHYLSEDYFFCDAAREIGYDTWLMPWVRTRHTGLFDYFLDIPALASLQADVAAKEANQPSAESAAHS